MHNQVINTHNRLNSNYFGTERQLVAELACAVLKLSDSRGVCWINHINGLYYLRYCVDDLDLLYKFISTELTSFKRDHALLLELKLNKQTINQNLDTLFIALDGADFIKQSHHVAYIKNYFKNAGDSSDVVRLGKNNLTDLCNILPQICNEQLSLTTDLLQTILHSDEYLVLGYYHHRALLGYIILHNGGNMEHIGFIRDVFVCSDLEADQKHLVGNSIFNSALNLFADLGFDKAVFWNEKNNLTTLELIEKYGFKPYDSEVIVYARYTRAL